MDERKIDREAPRDDIVIGSLIVICVVGSRASASDV